jgi:hypothetical protein
MERREKVGGVTLLAIQNAHQQPQFALVTVCTEYAMHMLSIYVPYIVVFKWRISDILAAST